MNYDKETAIWHKNDYLAKKVRNLENGLCEHGNYVGGCGADYICQWCEEGESITELNAYEYGISMAKETKAYELTEYLAMLMKTATPGLALRKMAKVLKENGITAI